MKHLCCLLAFVIASAMPAHSQADPHARALITDVIGDTSPEVFAFDEVPAGTVIDLGSSAEIRLTFYPTCDDVVIRGGKVEIYDDYLNIEGNGELLDHVQGECPSAVKLAESDIINAAVISRSVGVSINPRVNLRPTFGITGPNAANYETLLIRDGKKNLAKIALNGRKAEWPADAPDLRDGRSYAVALIGPNVKPHVAKVVASDAAPEILILRQ